MTVTPVSLELFKHAMATITDEMAITVVRTAHSNAVREMMDFSCALCDPQAQVVAQGLGLALHLGTMPDVVRGVHERGPYEPGDVMAVNDPYRGGTHLPDIYLVRPVFLDTTLLGYSAVNMHHVDVGGRTPGSVAPDNTEIFQEGLRIAPVHLYRRGEPNETLLSLIETNSRLPEQVLGDLRAQASACLIGQRGLIKLVDDWGLDSMREHMKALLDYTEKMARAEIARLPDGVYEFADYMDDDGVEGPEVKIAVTLTKHDDEIGVDFSGSSPQVRGALNCVLTMTKSAVYCTVRSVMRSEMPDNEGFCHPIKVTAPLGSVVNPVFPAAVAARGVTAHRICDAMLGALAQLTPGRVMAADEGGSTNVSIGGTTRDGQQFVLVEFVYGAWGARPDKDGIDGVANVFANLSNNPIEVIETEAPVRIESYGFVPDTGGAGRFRGGLSVRREYRLLNPTASLAVRSDRRKFPPHGLSGGLHGSPSWNIVNPGPSQRVLPTKVSTRLAEGDLFQTTLAGGGGVGDPFGRDPRRVLEDVIDGKVSVESARETYGVMLDTAAMQIDQAGTEQLRRTPRTSTAAD